MFDEMLTKLEDQDSNVYDAFFNWLEQQDFKKLHTQTNYTIFHSTKLKFISIIIFINHFSFF